MANDLETRVWEALRTVKYPGMSRDIVSFGFVRRATITAETVVVELEMSTHNPDATHRVRAEAEAAVAAVAGERAIEIQVKVSQPPSRETAAHQAITPDPSLLPEVEHVVAVASGKGGVGKSTVAANLAVRLGQLGCRTGLLDADIYGPSLPMMFGITSRPEMGESFLLPFERYGIKLMSLGFLVETDTPVIWRGPMVMKAVIQLLGDVEWGALDYLIVDLPPGTGDAQLTLTQKVPLSGAVIVTTPQDVALIDARKGLAMFKKVNVPVVGIIENMAGFVCPHCGETTNVFKSGGGERTAEVLGCPFLGSIPLDPAIVQGGDAGKPIVVADPEGAHAEAFRLISEAVQKEVTRRQRPKLKLV